MPRQTKVCRVCGKTYEACRSVRTGNNVFNWREVACSPECGTSYFQQIEASRNKSAKTSKLKSKIVKSQPAADVAKQDEESTLLQKTVDETVDEKSVEFDDPK